MLGASVLLKNWRVVEPKLNFLFEHMWVAMCVTTAFGYICNIPSKITLCKDHLGPYKYSQVEAEVHFLLDRQAFPDHMLGNQAVEREHTHTLTGSTYMMHVNAAIKFSQIP